jgi:hypothetical protein
VYVDKKNKFCPHCGQEMRKRRSPEQVSPTREVMQEQINATKEEAKEIVGSQKTRYSQSGGLAVRVGESIVGGYKIMYAKIKDLLEKPKKEIIPEDKNQQGTNKKKRKKKKKKRSSKSTK